MKLGIVGLPNVGKSTLFNAITKAGAECANYPFCTIEPNIGVVSVPDERLDVLTKMYEPDKTTPAVVEFVDIAGLVKGASKGEGLGNKFLSHIREVDAIIHVVRCFEDTNIVHVDGNVDTKRDVETINYELILADLDATDKRLEKTRKIAKQGDKRASLEVPILEKIKSTLENGNNVRSLEFNEEEQEIVRQFFLLTSKPVLYVANMREDEFQNPTENQNFKKLEEIAKSENTDVISICGKLEEEIASLEDSDRQEFLQELGIEKSGLDNLIQSSYKLLGLISFLTAGKQEVRAWTIVNGTKAPKAAGKIHTDFEKGFIRAEVVAYKDLIREGSLNSAKEKGLVRSEGKEYVMKDGDVVLFRFNV